MSAKASSSTRKFWRVEDVVLLEDDAVVNAVKAAAGGDKIFPGSALVAETFHEPLRFDAFVFKKTEEDEAVEGALGKFGERLAVEPWVLVLEGLARAVRYSSSSFRKDSSMLW